ncbi:MAG: queuosine precursor transporter [Sphaerochaetaceae bacterium]|jgi:hypothetical protein
MNMLLWFAQMLLVFCLIMLSFKSWGKLGLYIWIPISVIVANIQVTKNIQLFGMDATLGNIIYATGFLATDLLSEFYGPKASAKAVMIGFFSLVAMTVMMQFALIFTPSPSDISQAALSAIFGLMPRIALGSLIAYLLSNSHDIWAFEFWRKRKPGRNTLWIRNNFSTMVSQLIDSVIFTLIAFWGVYPREIVISIMISTYLLKWIVALCDTPFMYLGRKWFEQGKIPQEI